LVHFMEDHRETLFSSEALYGKNYNIFLLIVNISQEN
jgi:hypothetical protein